MVHFMTRSKKSVQIEPPHKWKNSFDQNREDGDQHNDTKSDLLFALLERSRNGIAAFDAFEEMSYFNNQFREIWNFPEDMIYIGSHEYEIMRYCAKQMINPTLFMQQVDEIQKSIQMIWDNPVYLLNKKVFHIFSSPLHGVDGTYYGRTWEVLDDTENYLREQTFEEAISKLILKHSQLISVLGQTEGIWAWDVRTELFTFNHEFARQYRSLHERQFIESFLSVVHFDERDRCLRTLFGITKNNPETPVIFEFRLKSIQGDWHRIMFHGVVSEVEHDVPVAVTGTCNDITERDSREEVPEFCPVEVAMGYMGSEWDIVIAHELFAGEMRFTELMRSLNVYSKMLTTHLRVMEERGIIRRTEYAEAPPRVGYSLTELGQSLKPIYDAMWQWPGEMKEIQLPAFMANKRHVLIVRELLTGTKRFIELKNSLKLTSRILTQHLQVMEEQGVVHREPYPGEMPPRVEYSLTELGQSLKPIYDVMWNWGDEHREFIGKNRDL
jgi:DNA-binding HxlR family transcriptional regulator/PAS domain-containing protein